MLIKLLDSELNDLPIAFRPPDWVAIVAVVATSLTAALAILVYLGFWLATLFTLAASAAFMLWIRIGYRRPLSCRVLPAHMLLIVANVIQGAEQLSASYASAVRNALKSRWSSDGRTDTDQRLMDSTFVEDCAQNRSMFASGTGMPLLSGVECIRSHKARWRRPRHAPTGAIAMQRREFISIATTGSAALLLPNLLTGCSATESRAYEGWEGHAADESDIRRVVLAYAVLAPNPHNKQPWMIEFKGTTGLALYVDPNRLLPETDPPYRQIHIGQGTFLENLDLAARRMGYHAEIDWFPSGMYANSVLEPKPVASIELVKEATVQDDPLFDAILARRSNKRAYDGTPLAPEAVAELKAACQGTGPCSLTLQDAPNELEKLRDIMREAMQIEVGSPARDAETLAMFRFDEGEVSQYRDGFSVANSGMTGLKRWVAESFFLSRESAERDPTAFGAQAVDMTTDQAASASAFGWLVTPSNTRLDQVLAGRAYERLNLAATAAGVAMHPLSQVLQEYPDMVALQRRFKRTIDVPDTHTVQMLFRLGHAEPTQHTARRALSDFVIDAEQAGVTAVSAGITEG